MRKVTNVILILVIVGLVVAVTVLCLWFLVFDTQKDSCQDLPIVTRAEWRARPPKSIALLNPSDVVYAFIHHTYIPSACNTSKDCAQKVRDVQNYHMDDRNWDDIGYSFLIGGDNKIYEGRGWDRQGAHTKGFNSVGLGFCFIGDFTSTLPTPESMTLVQKLIACGVKIGKIQPSYTLRGHRDMGSTECPGDALYKEIQGWAHYY